MNSKKLNNSTIGGIKTGIINIDNIESTIKSLLELNQPQNLCQIVSANTIVCEKQVFFAIEQALSAIQNSTSFSKKAELEFLLRVYGTKQINQALDKAQLKAGKNEIVLVCCAKDKKELQELFKQAQKTLLFKEKKIQLGKNKKELMKIYGISEKELKTLSDLINPLEAAIIERNALVVFAL